MKQMVKDISDYIICPKSGGIFKKSVKEISGKRIVLKSWEVLDSKYPDGKPSGKYARMRVSLDGKDYFVNCSSAVLLGQLELLAPHASAEGFEGAECVIKYSPSGAVLESCL